VPGFFGKIPSHGDFVTRDLPRGFLDGWDAWLQACIAESKKQLGDGWLDVYLTSPIWRFGLVAGVCGPQAWAGILMPSVDRVGRYFPLTIAAPVQGQATPLHLPASADPWFEALESAALRALDDDRFDANALREALARAGEPSVAAGRGETASAMGKAWSLGVVGVQGGEIAAALAHTLVTRAAPSYSLWWTPGAADAQPAAVAVAALPEPACFVDLLRGAQLGHAAAPAAGAAAGGQQGAASP
jgi:type VI secretion system protein ImpM